ncbi:MAG: C10 family peptidase, partial [Bacteroidales bacterium]|nr:C10 family peptidase [Bacteroidales bacterium]
MKNKLLLSLIIVFVSISTLKAKTVNSETAALVAKNYYFQQVNTFENELSYNAIIIKNSITETRAGNTIAYIYEFTNGGMVVVSGQDAFDPVIYYSSNKYTTWKLANQNPEFQYFINSFFDAVEYTIKTNYQPEENITAAWQQYTVANPETLIAAKNDVEVGPLLKTEWNQDYPYNYYAPLANGGPGGRCYAGCVATAMSVVMEYWRWPLQGTGQTAYYCYPYGILEVDFSQAFYNWDAMLTTLDGNKSEKAIFAIAELQYNAGVSVQMSYDPTGSGAQSGSVPNAVQSFFKYPYANYFSRDNNEATWVSTIIEQLDNGYVLYYSGHSSDGGHAWNCDGYRIIDGVTTFHQNFGWGGSSNGW